MARNDSNRKKKSLKIKGNVLHWVIKNRKKIFTGRPKAIRDVYIYFKKQTLYNDVRTTYKEVFLQRFSHVFREYEKRSVA